MHLGVTMDKVLQALRVAKTTLDLVPVSVPGLGPAVELAVNILELAQVRWNNLICMRVHTGLAFRTSRTLTMTASRWLCGLLSSQTTYTSS